MTATITTARESLAPQIFLEERRRYLEQQLAQFLPSDECAPESLHHAMRYALLSRPGKRLRPLLVYCVAEGLGGDRMAVTPAAISIECIHCYSLVHDDLPAMDNDLWRSGQPACHVAFGEAMAILAGDALQAFAMEVLTGPRNVVSAAVQAQLVLTLAKAMGSLGMAGGQAMDLTRSAQYNEETIIRLHCMKTGALMSAALQMGALASQQTQKSLLNHLDQLGIQLGLAFQIQDDLQDLESDQLNAQSRGSSVIAGQDIQTNQCGQSNQKNHTSPSYPQCVGILQARETLAELLQEIQKTMQQLPFETKYLVALQNMMLNL